MLTKIQEYSLHNRVWIIILVAIASIVGLYSMMVLPIDAVPDITNPQVVINTKTGAFDPEQIEKTVTYYIETEMAGLPRVTDVRSLSKFGLSQVVVIFEDGTDIYHARQLVLEKLQNVREELPRGVSPELGPISTGLGEVLMYVVKAKKKSALNYRSEQERLLYLRTVQDFIIRPYLKSVIPNTAEIDVAGGYKKEIHINIIPPKLASHGITIDAILKKLETLGENYGGGYIERDGRQIIVRTEGTMSKLSAIGNIPIKLDIHGNPVRLKDIAQVQEDHAQRLGAATYNGRETVLGTVFMLLGANSRQVAVDAEKALKETPLPPDVEVEVVYTRGFLVNATIKTVTINLAEGAGLVMIVLLLILGNFRAAVIVSLAIPVSMLFAASGMNAWGISANLMSLGAIDFGLLVDGSVVMIENYLRRLEEREHTGKTITPKQKMALIKDSCGEVVRPVAFGLFIIMVVYIPILGLEGIEGKMFKPMALTVLMALGASLVVAIFLMPVLAYSFIKTDRQAEKDPYFFRILQKAYPPALDFSLHHKTIMLSIALAVIMVSGILFIRMGSDFVPQLDEGDMSIAFVRNFDISLEEALAQQVKCETIIAQYPEVERVYNRMGVAEAATDPMGINMADTFVILKKNRSQWPLINGKRRTKQELFEAIRKDVEKAVPGQEIIKSQPIELRFNEILEGSRADVTLRIYGPDLEKLSEYVDQAEEILKKVPGASEVELDPITSLRKSPILNVRLKYDAINRYGVTLSEVNEIVETAMGGRQIGSFYEYDWRFPIIVRMAESYRKNIKAIGDIPVSLEDGGTIPLALVTDISEIRKVANVARNRSKRYSAVSINLGNRDMLSFVTEAQKEIHEKLNLPDGYYTYWGGKFKNLERARNRLMIIVPIILAVIFIIILRNFNSVKQTLLVYSSIPFAVTGGIIALTIRGIHFSVSAGIGFIALSGIAILNSLVMVTFINQLREKGIGVKKAVIEGARIRLRPVIMTALVASLGFLPMAVNTGLGAEVQRPLATVVIGGLITSTLLTLLLLPILYLITAKE